jgi:hypothetical protein
MIDRLIVLGDHGVLRAFLFDREWIGDELFFFMRFMVHLRMMLLRAFA